MLQDSASNLLPDASARLRPLHFIFVERGQRMPQRRPPRGEHEVVIVGESPDGASTRHAIQRIARLEREGRRIRQSEILVAAADTAASPGAGIEERAALAIALVRHMAKAGRGDLTFIAEESCSRALRCELLALVDTLLTTMGSRGVGLRVQFGGIGDSH
jgi:hypothetical protein